MDDSIDEVAVISTGQGEMVVELWDDVAPGTVVTIVGLKAKPELNGSHGIICLWSVSQ